jgi:hypothetical protein
MRVGEGTRPPVRGCSNPSEHIRAPARHRVATSLNNWLCSTKPRSIRESRSLFRQFGAMAPDLGPCLWPSSDQRRAHNSYYEPCPFYARNGMLHRFSFVNLSKGLAGLRARSLSQGKSSGRIAGAGRLKEVVAHKAFKGEGIQRSERERTKIGLTLTSLKSSAFVNLHLVINGPNECAKDHQGSRPDWCKNIL